MFLSTAMLLCSLSVTPILRWDPSGAAGVQDGTGTWDGVTSNWTANSGSSNRTWADGAIAQFGGGSSGTAGTVTVSGTQSCTGLQFDTPFAGNYTLATGTITLTGSGEVTVNGGTPTVSAAVAGSVGLRKKGAGTVTLSGTLSYTGTTNVDAGTLAFGGVNQWVPGAVAGSGSISKSGGAGYLYFPGDVSAFSGTITCLANDTYFDAINGGSASMSVVTGSGGSTGRAILQNIAASPTYTVDFGSLTGSADVGTAGSTAGTLTLRVGSKGLTETFAGSLTQDAGRALALEKVGTGTLSLSGTVHTYTGATTVSAGTLAFTGAANFTGTYAGALSVASGATLEWASSASRTFSGTLTGSGTVKKSTSSSSTWTLSGNSSAFAGTFDITLGTIAIGHANALGAGTVQLNGGTLTSSSINPSGLTGIVVGASGGTISGTNWGTSTPLTGSGALTVSVTGGFIGLTGDISAYAGAMTVAGVGSGIVEWAAQSGVGGSTAMALTVNSGLKLYADDSAGTNNNTVNIGSLTGSGTIYGSGGVASRAGIKTLSVGALNTDTTFSGVIANTDSGGATVLLKKVGTGTLTLAGTNTYSSGTTVTTGTLVVGNGSTAGALGTGTVTVSSGTTLAFDRSDAVSVSRLFSGTGTILKKNTNTLTLNSNAGDSSFSGPLVISAGVVSNDGNNGQLNPGTITLNDTSTGSNNTRFHWDHSGAGGDASYSRPFTVANQGTGVATISCTGGSGSPTRGFSGTVTANKDVTFNTTGAAKSTYFTGVISGAGNVTVNGTGASSTGTIEFRAANTYTGSTTISAGTLCIGSIAGGTSGSITSSSGVSVASGATLSLNRTDTVTFSNTISGAGNVVKAFTGTTTLSATSTYTGTTSINAGTLAITGSISSSAVTVASGAAISGGSVTTGVTGALTFSAVGSKLSVGATGGTPAQLTTGTITAASGLTVDLTAAMSAGTFTLLANSGTLPVTLPTLGTNSSGRTPTFLWTAGTGLQVLLV